MIPATVRSRKQSASASFLQIDAASMVADWSSMPPLATLGTSRGALWPKKPVRVRSANAPGAAGGSVAFGGSSVNAWR